ncbi:MAG: autotransporter-associated beta strand repeat-containing protein, partial [Pirellulaceae bacterium]|nr:autotransporter-associated beta strand repeat-containing protein [Pirellulaceae bacterium]
MSLNFRSRAARSRIAVSRTARLRRRRVFFERLEDRSLLAVFAWNAVAADNNWNNPANWTLTSGVDNGTIGIPDAGDDAQFNTVSNQLSPTLSGPISLTNLSFSGTATGFNVTGSTLTVGTNTTNSAGANAVSSNLIGGGTVTVNGGTLTLSGANTLGLATIGGGTLSINTNNAAAGAVAINSGGVFEINGVTHDAAVALNSGGTLRGVGGSAVANGTITVANAAVTIGTGGSTSDLLTLGDGASDLTGGGASAVVSITGSGVVALTQTSALANTSKWNIGSGSTLSFSAETQLTPNPGAVVANHITLAGTLRATAAATMTFNVNRGITTTGTTGAINVSDAAGVLTVSSVITGTDITKTGAGTVTFGATNTFTGPLNIAGGVLQAGAIGNLGG